MVMVLRAVEDTLGSQSTKGLVKIVREWILKEETAETEDALARITCLSQYNCSFSVNSGFQMNV